MIRILILVFLFPTALLAEEQTLTPDEFEAFTTGKTLYFSQRDQAYGVEQYLKGRRTIWAFADGSCNRGKWFEEDGAICFTYENNPVVQCWSFHKNDGTYSARVLDADPDNDLVVIGRIDAPMSCAAPDVGV